MRSSGSLRAARLVESSNGDVFINAATGSSHLRINGPLIPQPVGRHYP